MTRRRRGRSRRVSEKKGDAEKRMAGIQRRQGPNAVGVYGRRTPMADGRKLLLKETVVPTAADEMKKTK